MLDTVSTSGRLTRAQQELRDRDLDLLLVSPSSDLRYLAGHAGHASERLTVLTIPTEGAATLLAPTLELPGITPAPGVRQVAWSDGEDPFARLQEIWANYRSLRRIAVNDQTWANVLLRLQSHNPDAAFVSAAPLLSQLRIVKSDEELALLARAGELADAAFADLVQLRFSGRSEREIAHVLNDLLRSHGLEKAEWGPIVASGPHGASPHHAAGTREIHEGDAVVLDFGGTVEGYQADITRTVHVGTPSDEFRAAYECVRVAQEAAVGTVRPALPAGQVDATARQIIDDSGYGEFFIHRTGHGLGLDTHEEPYLVAGNQLALAPGMVFSVEPGVYLPGRFGIRIEDSVAVSTDGAIRFNRAVRSLIVVH